MTQSPLHLHVPDSAPAPTGRFELMGARSAALSQAYGRVVFISACFLLAFLVISIRAFDLMILQGALVSYRAQDGTEQKLTSTVSQPRVDIVDRNGVLLATSIKMASLYADPHLIMDPVEAAKGLSKIFPDLTYGEMLQKLQSDKRFVWIKRNLTPDEQAAVLELGQPGLAFQEEYRRLYPQGALTSHIVGYSGVDGQGLSGIEQGFNSILSENKIDQLPLTIDIRLQHILRREVEKTVADFTAQGGTGVIMDIHNGDVLAAVSFPDFDPHQPATAKPEQKFNRFALGSYELGSTFKIFTTAALLEQQQVPMSQTFDSRNPIKVGRFTINDYHPEHRDLTIPEIFMYSSNLGTAHMAQQIGTEGLKNFFAQLGFFEPLAFDLPEVGYPQVPKPWREVSTLTTSYGHGIAITPMQLAAATASIIGDGTTVRPHLLLNEKEKVRKALSSARGDRVVSESTSHKLRQLLRLVVRHGTGSKAEVPGMLVGGKTGTAEKNINGRYINNSLISSFVGAFPMNDPRYLVLVSIDDPHPNKQSYGYATAGWTAAPTAGRVVTGMAAVLGLTPHPDAPDPADALTSYLAEFRDKPAPVAKSNLSNTTKHGVSPVAAVIPLPE